MLRQLAFTFYICLNLITSLCVSAHIQKFSDAHIKTQPAYIISSMADFLNSTMCGKELQNFRDAVDQRILWSLRVLDSNGGFKPGFIYGNNYWLGSRNQCLDTMNRIPLQISQKVLKTLYRDPQEEFLPFKINYFVAHFRYNSTVQYHKDLFNEDMITLGLCLPASCTINDLNFILERIFRDRIIDDFFFTDFQLIQLKDLKNDDEWLSGGALPFICVAFVFFFLMTTIGTIYDIFMLQKRIKKNEMNKTKNNNKINNNGIENISEEMKIKVNSPSHQKSKIGEILICFSAYTNTKKIFSTKLDAATIPVIHGLKLLSMCFIIIYHSVYYNINFFDNKGYLLRFFENHGYIIDIGFLSVDLFFISSGCLVTYLYLKNKTNKELIKPINCREKLIDFFINIIKRFIRLTPAYIMVLGLSQLSSAWFNKTSQFYIYERSHETCAKFWWRNVLYINNFFGFDTMCMSWSWHLSNDMQFYIIAMLLLILSTIYFYIAVMILSTLLIGSIILSGYISYVYEYVPTFDELNRLISIIYHPPWMRIHPYIVGIITGYILIKLNNNFVLKTKIIFLCWCLALACKLSVIFVLYNRSNISILATSIYIALHRIFWAVGIAWIVIACSTKHGGIVNQLLSFKGWIPLSRLTYCAYLLNPVIIQLVPLYSEMPIHFEFLSLILMNAGYITISYFCSYVLSLMVEIPCILLMRMFIQRNRMHEKVL